MEFQTDIIQTPREISGPRTSNRFDFHKDWIICKLLEMHKSEKDYLVIVDLHEDVVILNSSKDPQTGKFIQIKTKEGGKWSIATLCKKEKGGGSKLGKLYLSKVRFRNNVDELRFVSNSPLKAVLKKGDSTKNKETCFIELDENEKKFLLSSLSEELGLPEDEIKSEIITLEVTDLGINSHSDATKGKLSDFIEKENPQAQYRVGVAYRALFDEIRKRANEEFACNSFQDLVKMKSISKEFFQKILDLILKNQSRDVWSDVVTQLTGEKFSITDIKSISRCWKRYQIERMDQENITLQKIRDKISWILGKQPKIKKFSELLDQTIKEYNNSPVKHNVYDEDYIKAIVIYEFYAND